MTESSPGAPQESGRGALVLTLGILSLIICALLGPVAWIMGKGDLEKMDKGTMAKQDRTLTKAGMICGIIATVLLIVGILAFLFVGVLGGTAGALAD